MLDAIIGFFMFVIAMVVFFGAVVVAVLIQNSGGSNHSSYDEDEDDEDEEETCYIIEATNNTNLGYMKVGSSNYESSAIRAAESYLNNGRSGYRARVVEVVNGKRRGTVWSS